MTAYERAKTATHAYICIHEGTCKGAAVDLGDSATAKWVGDWIKGGCTVERVPMEMARSALMQPWPLVGEALA